MKLLILALAFAFTGCAAMQQEYEDRNCNYDAAFESGANAARERGEMNGSMIASNCPVQVRDQVMSGYRAGYASVPPRPIIQQPVAPVIVVQPSYPNTYRPPAYPGGSTYVPPAGIGAHIPPNAPPPQQCIEAYGKRVCGYGCREAYGNIRCASSPRHSCMDSYGKIYCGLNCREQAGRVICDEWD